MVSKKKIYLTLGAAITFVLSACDGDEFLTFPKDNETAPVNQTENKQTTTKKEDDVITLPQGPLQKGDQGNDVKTLKKVLNQLDYGLDETNRFDDKTVWALTDFQLQIDGVDITGIFDSKTKLALEAQLAIDNRIKPEEGLSYQEDTKGKSDITVTGNPYEILVLVNKEHALPDNFIPKDLVTPNVRFPFTEDLPKKQMREVAADALEKMFDAADEEGLELFAQSGFRSFERQEDIFAANVEKNGEKAANKYSARPGESEHQTGLTMDVTSADVNFDLIIEFGDTPEGKWVEKHASDYGFIIRYPEEKEDVTKYQFEPWHLRYVGEKAAKEIKRKNITLEEYLEDL